MKAAPFAAGLVGLIAAGLSVATMAACASPSVRVNTIASLTLLLQNNTACVPAGLPVPLTMTWQELHQPPGSPGSTGPLVDYKRGPGDAVDPSKPVGTWQITGADGRGVFVQYDYGGGQIYTYTVWDNLDGNTHSFCRSASEPEIVVRVKLGGGAC